MNLPRPVPGPPRDYRFPRFVRHTLSNGVELLLAPVARVPLASIIVLSKHGATLEASPEAGIGALAVSAMAEGTARLSADELADRFERLGGALEPDIDWDSARLETTVGAAHLRAALSLMAEVITEPGFRERDVTRLRDERLADLLQQRAEPRGLADDAFLRVVYDAEARHALPLGGSEETVVDIMAEAVRRHHEQLFRPADTTIVVAGAVQVDDAIASAEAAFAGWRSAAEHGENEATASVEAPTGRWVRVVDKSDAVQSEIRVGHIGPPRKHADFFALAVMNAVLGGLFNSRINLKLREELGYTYGARSAFEWHRRDSIFGVSTAVQSDATIPSLEEILREIDRIRSGHIAADELSLAISYIDGVFPIRFETTQAICEALATLEAFDLPDDYFDTYRGAIRGVTLDDVQRVASTHLRSEDLRCALVVKAETVVSRLHDLGIENVVVVDPAGTPVG